MASPRGSRAAWVVAAAAVALALVPPALLQPAVVPLRFAAAALLLAIVAAKFIRPGSWWLSPLLPLGGAAVLFFAVIPALVAPGVLARGAGFLALGPGNMAAFAAYPGSVAEILVLQFGVVALALDGLVGRTNRLVIANVVPARVLGLIGPLAVAAGGLPLVAPPALAGVLPLLPPVVAVATLALAEAGLALGWRRLPLALAPGVLALALMVAGGTVKAVLFIAAALLLRLLAAAPGRGAVGLAAVATLAATLATLVSMDRLRYHREPPPLSVEALAASATTIVVSKGAARQAETGFCLLGVAERHLGQSATLQPLLLAAQAVVPRVVWPEKPSLSLGHAYAADYCKIAAADLSAHHSAAITLLGQPLAAGGRGGLLAAEALMLAALAGLARLAGRGGAFRVAVAALLPWLMDFDQDFAMAVGNAVKAGLVIAPLAALAALAGRRPGKTLE